MKPSTDLPRDVVCWPVGLFNLPKGPAVGGKDLQTILDDPGRSSAVLYLRRGYFFFRADWKLDVRFARLPWIFGK